MRLDAEYQTFLKCFAGDHHKLVARLLSSPARKFARQRYAEPGNSTEDCLQALFSEVMKRTNEFRDYTAENSHTDLIKSWSKGTSSKLAVATYFFLYTQRDGQHITEELDHHLFDGIRFRDRHGFEVPGCYQPVDDRPHSLKFGASRTIRDIDEEYCPELILLEPGTFQMGSDPFKEYDRDSFESPRHTEVIHRKFALSKFPITLGQFNYFASTTKHVADHIHVWDEEDGWVKRRDQDWRSPGFVQSPSHPVVGVSYHDALKYCRWLSRITRQTYRLPSEAEWEYACRAGSETPFSWGESISPSQAKYDHREVYRDGNETAEFTKGTVSVEKFEPNAWGFYQMHGNVWEWCADPWNDNYLRTLANGMPRERGDKDRAVVRGGAWLSIPNKLRSAKRDWDGRGLRGDTVGFRVARDI